MAIAATAVAGIVLLEGCGPKLVDTIQFAPIDWYEPAPMQDLMSPGPQRIVAGDPAPFDGFMVSVEDWQSIRDGWRRMESELDDAQDQSRRDRQFATVYSAGQAEGLRVCRQAQIYAFGAGVGVGAGGCAALDRAIDESTR